MPSPEFFEARGAPARRAPGEAFALGARVYAESPGAFVRRMAGYWDAGQHSRVRAP